MNREDVIRMAREVGFDMPEKVATTDSDWHAFEVEQVWQRIERLVDIARAAEREACAKVIEDIPEIIESAQNHTGGCLICGFTPKLAAAAIRARGTLKQNDELEEAWEQAIK